MWTLPFGFFASGGVRHADITLIDTNSKHANVTLTRASVAWYLDASQILTKVANNVARYDYDGYGSYLGLLVEPTRTNRVIRSDQTLANYNFKSGVTAAGSPLAAYFTNSVQYPTSTATTNYALVNASAGANVLFSIFVRMDDNSAPVIGANSTSGDFCISAFGSGTTTNIAASPYETVYMGGGVYRISGYNVGASAGVAFGIFQYPTQSGKGFRITGLDVESGSPMSSYIGTISAPVSRAVDTISTTLATIGISAVAGTLFIEHTAASGAALFSSGANAILSSQGAGKIAIAYDATGTRICYNGGAVTTGSALTFSTALRIAMSTASIATTCHIKKCTWHNTKLSASDLQTLTT